VAAPAAIACYWPKEGAPGEFPSFKAVDPLVLAGAALFSLPLYVLFAALQISITKLLPFHMDAGLVEPLTANNPLAFLWIWISIALLPAITEEFFYRGVMQSAAMKRWGPWVGLGVTAVLFSVVHLELAGGLSRILMGLWFGYLFWRTKSLWAGALAHACNNTWGVALANWHQVIEPNLNAVYALAALCLLAGYACFHKAGFWPWLQDAESKADAPELPYFVTMARPEPPRADK
jgi:membrane protease YdiL (CAAX protease family)